MDFFFVEKERLIKEGKGWQTTNQEEEGHVAWSGLSWFLLRQ